MHRLLDAASFLYEKLTQDNSEKDLANAFWKFSKRRFLIDVNQKTSMADFCENLIKMMDEESVMDQLGINLANIKKSKTQLRFVAETMALLFKSSGIKLVD